jgi:hypothetical protein
MVAGQQTRLLVGRDEGNPGGKAAHRNSPRPEGIVVADRIHNKTWHGSQLLLLWGVLLDNGFCMYVFTTINYLPRMVDGLQSRVTNEHESPDSCHRSGNSISISRCEDIIHYTIIGHHRRGMCVHHLTYPRKVTFFKALVSKALSSRTDSLRNGTAG